MVNPKTVLSIKTAPAGRGLDWLIDGFKIFSKNWLVWIAAQILLLILLLILCMFLAILVPFIGIAFQQLILPVIFGGILLGCREVDRGGNFDIAHLFAGFTNHLGQLLIIGIVHLLGTLAILVICVIVLIVLMGGFAVVTDLIQSSITAINEQDLNRLIEISSQFAQIILLVELTALALYLPLLLLIWFAPVLVVLEHINAIAAMKYSFIGCMKNIIPYLVYGVIGLIFSIIATIPLGLGWLILTPMIIASVYLAYKDIYQVNQV